MTDTEPKIDAAKEARARSYARFGDAALFKIDAAWIDEVLLIAEAADMPGGWFDVETLRQFLLVPENDSAGPFIAIFDPPTIIRMLKELRRLLRVLSAIGCLRIRREGGGRTCDQIRYDGKCYVCAALAAQEKP